MIAGLPILSIVVLALVSQVRITGSKPENWLIRKGTTMETIGRGPKP